MFYEKVTWDGNIKEKTSGRYTNCKHCIVVDLILKYSQNDSKLGRNRYIIFPSSMQSTL